MTDTPNYGFNRYPQFSVNHISDYLSTVHATQRTKLICAAKFPKKVEVAAYSQVRQALKRALTTDNFDRDGLDFLAGKLEARTLMESGYNRDEALRCIKAVRAFQDTFTPRRFGRYELSANPKTLLKSISGVKLKVSLDALVTQSQDGEIFAGGLILLYAFSSDRTAITDRLAAASALILWALEDGQMQPLPRLCMAVDLAETKVVKASRSHERFRERVEASCSEVAARWNEIEPPHDYDGPDWR
ncbi:MULTISPECIES: hypothetical protein [unclassified Labrenzia]|uniref:hypothetical protein n=1 Tax=unclassified Labrenzia TaxID=2648686 RepID=UPI001267F591|nr:MULTISPECIES: hypothetical protein [unclassified Labrenzia]